MKITAREAQNLVKITAKLDYASIWDIEKILARREKIVQAVAKRNKVSLELARDHVRALGQAV